MDRSQIYSHAVRAGVVALSLSAFHCMTKPVEPVMPTWDVNLVAPVASRTYTLGELVEKDPSLLGVAPGGTQIMLKTSVQADPTYVGDRISLEPMGDTVHSELGPSPSIPGCVDVSFRITPEWDSRSAAHSGGCPCFERQSSLRSTDGASQRDHRTSPLEQDAGRAAH